MSKRTIALFILAFSLLLLASGCKKKTPPPPPPPPPAPKVEAPAPNPPAISEFVAEPSSIERGQSATLRWTVADATEVAIDSGLGSVPVRGTRQVFPTNTTTYTLTAKGPGGSVTETATVTVTAPPPPPPAPKEPERTLSERLSTEVQDVFYDYDKSDIREDARAILTKNADALKAILSDFPNASIALEGHCDERGSAEYNLGLGDRRATSAKEFLVQLGVPSARLNTISYGKEKPQCTDASEECYQRNRRAHFSGQ